MSNDHSSTPAALTAGQSPDHGQPVVIGSGGGFGGLDHFEKLAIYSAHMKIANRDQSYADEARAKAAERGLLWQRWLKRAMIYDRRARERIKRARMFLPNAASEPRRGE